jgi:hypothetical protein
MEQKKSNGICHSLLVAAAYAGRPPKSLNRNIAPGLITGESDELGGHRPPRIKVCRSLEAECPPAGTRGEKGACHELQNQRLR